MVQHGCWSLRPGDEAGFPPERANPDHVGPRRCDENGRRVPGEDDMAGERSRMGQAVVLGGSMAGLLAARVLSDHFETVTIVERDDLPREAAHRRGVPQSRHTHGLLASGIGVLERLFPGLGAELLAAGAVPCDSLRDLRWVFEGAPLAQHPSGIDGLMLSRPCLEAAVRRRTEATPRIVFREASHVERLTASSDGRRVTGVELRDGATLTADLVVDATGRGSRLPDWLATLGYDAPIEQRVEIGLTYTTRYFRRRPEHLQGDAGAVVPPTPEGKRGGVMIAQEGDRWSVTLIAHFVPGAPMDLAGFIDFTTRLPTRDIHDVVAQAEPVGDPVSSKFPASVRRRYERLTRWPEGLLTIGDAICSFNPIYGQGMSVSALEAMALHEVLAAGRRDIGRRFFRAAARIVDTPWTTAVGNDLRMPETVGPRSVAVTAINRYMTRLHRVAHHDGTLAIRFMRVANLLAPPQSLMTPSSLWRVWRGASGRVGGSASIAGTPAPSRT
ncbi:MAG: FAD-dependent monooxygenase [Vicinamibacterales bacterium]